MSGEILCENGHGSRTVLGDVVEVVAADDDGAGHLGGDDTAGEDAATDGDIAREGALLVCFLCEYGYSNREQGHAPM